MANLLFSAGMPAYDWVLLFDSVLDLGVLSSTDNTAQTSITLTSGSTRLVIDGIGLTADGARHFTAGTITGITLIQGTQVVAAQTNFSSPPGIGGLQAALSEYDKPAPDFLVIQNALNSVVRAEALNITGNGDGQRIYTSLTGGDTVLMGGGDDVVHLTNATTTSYLNGESGFDFLAFDPVRTVGVIADFDIGEVRDRNTNALLATMDNMEGFLGTVGNDRVQSSYNEDDSFFFAASLGNDRYRGTHGDSYTRLSYLFLQDDWGVAGGVSVNFATGTIVKPAGAGTDNFSGIDTVQGTDFGDVFVGDTRDNEFQGMGGVDSFNGSAGRDTVNYQDEAFRPGGVRGVFVNLSDSSSTGEISGVVGNITVAAHKGLDAYGNLESLVSIEDIRGTRRNDRLIGDNSDNELRGREGNDKIYGNGGRDRIDGGDGADYLVGGDGDDDITGGRSSDTLLGGVGNDHLDGGEGSDLIDAGSGDFDNIAGSSGTDVVNGGIGYDMIAFDEYDPNDDANEDGNPGGQNEHAADSISVTIKDGVGTGSITGFFGILSTNATPTKVAVNTSFSNVERVRGTYGNDSFTVGTGFSNTEEANDTFGDPVRGGAGAFSFVGGKGADTFTDVARTGLALVDYDEEKWTHDDFNDDDGRRWGDNGEAGVAINASSSSKTIAGWGTVAAGKAIDTWGNIDTINGVAAFRLSDAADVIYAADIDTYVDGRDGNDTFNGGSKADQFNGGRGNDTANGGAGNDQFNGDDGDDTMNGGTGNDQVNGQRGADVLHGNDGNDNLNGDDDNDELYGDAGRDNLSGGSGNDLLEGGAGNDQLRGDSGNDTLRGGLGEDQIEGGDGDDHGYGDDGDDRIYGESGNDDLHGGLGDDRLEGDDGDDTIFGDDDASTNSLGGNDQIRGGWGNDTIYGGFGQDRIDGNQGQDTINGGAGDDEVHGNEDNDTINGESGEDRLFGDSGNDTINGGDGDDAVNGGEGDDTLYGGLGNDNVYAGDGNFVDLLFGGGGNDKLDGGLGNDIMNGDDGDDDLFGDFGDDVMNGGNNNDAINGAEGNDILSGNAGNDNLYGGDDAGNDTLSGGSGADYLSGGLGNDTYVLDAEVTGIDTVDDEGGIDLITSTIARSLVDYAWIENLTLLGTSGIAGTGNGFDNVITGNGSTNTLTGNAGNDTLDGLAGNDTLLGGNGFDTLIGGIGKDTMTGGADDDVFAFNALSDFGNALATRDIIKDFSKVLGNRDVINLSALDADSLTGGDQSFVFFATKGSAFNGTKGALTWSQAIASGSSTDRTIVQGDLDGDGISDFQLELSGLINLTASDFLL